MQYAQLCSMILSELTQLIQFIIYRGIFCPLMEDRAPALSEKDGDGKTNMSYAQRKRQIYLVGLGIIEKCRIFKFDSQNPEIKKFCTEIQQFLDGSLEKICTVLILFINNSAISYENEFFLSKSIAKLQGFIDTFESLMEKTSKQNPIGFDIPN